MKTFQQFLEMATNTGENAGGMERAKEYESLLPDFKQVIKDNYGSQHYKIIKSGASYYLTDENEKYLGYVELTKSNESCKITYSHSTLKGGFYNLMFSGILAYTDCKEILSDSRLSEQAIKSYANLANKGHLLVQVLTKEGYKPFSREELLSDAVNRVSVKAKIPLKEHIDEFPREGTHDVTLFNKRSPAYDERIFCEPIAVHNCTTEFLESIDYPIPSNKR